MSTRIISTRISTELYDEILLYCNSKGISISEWLHAKILIAKLLNQHKTDIIKSSKMIHFYSVCEDDLEIAARLSLLAAKLDSLLLKL